MALGMGHEGMALAVVMRAYLTYMVSPRRRVLCLPLWLDAVITAVVSEAFMEAERGVENDVRA